MCPALGVALRTMGRLFGCYIRILCGLRFRMLLEGMGVIGHIATDVVFFLNTPDPMLRRNIALSAFFGKYREIFRFGAHILGRWSFFGCFVHLFVRVGALLSDRIGPIYPAASGLSIRPLRAYLSGRFGAIYLGGLVYLLRRFSCEGPPKLIGEAPK